MLTKQRGEFEMQVMNIVWQLENCTVQDVLKEVQKTRQVAYTTVATILQRLCDKGLVKRVEAKSHLIYSPQLSKLEYSKKMISSFMQNVTHTFGDAAMASFAESIEDLPKKNRDQLLQLLKDYENK